MNDFHMLLVCQFYLLVRRAKMVHPVSLRVMYIDVMAGARLMGDVVGIRRKKKYLMVKAKVRTNRKYFKYFKNGNSILMKMVNPFILAAPEATLSTFIFATFWLKWNMHARTQFQPIVGP